jgi:CHASE3 domain sensor protein
MAETQQDNAAETQNGGQRSPEEIQREIEQTRGELADTVAAVAEKADVKAQARKKVDETKARAQDKVEEAKTRAQEVPDAARQNPVPYVIAGAVAALVVIALIRRG